MVSTATPQTFLTGESVTDTAFSKDGAGAWTTLAITDTFSEIGTTGIYEIDLTAAEMNHDQVLIKLISTNTADSFVMFQMFANDIDDITLSNGSVDANVERWRDIIPNILDGGRLSTREQPTEEGIAQAGASLSITLRSGASSITNDPQLIFHMVRIVSGTGVGQRRLASNTYNGSTKVLAIGSAWSTTPDATSKYEILEAIFADANLESWRGEEVRIQTKGSSGLINYPPVILADIDDVGGTEGMVGLNTIGIFSDLNNGRIAGIIGTINDFDGLNNLSVANVNAEISDVLKTDTIAEMPQQAPPTNPTLEEAIMYLFMAWRNNSRSTSTERSIENNAGTKIAKATQSDDGTLYSQGKMISGP